MKRLIADRGYDADALRARYAQTGTTPILPGRRPKKAGPARSNPLQGPRHIEAAFLPPQRLPPASPPATTNSPPTRLSIALAAVIGLLVLGSPTSLSVWHPGCRSESPCPSRKRKTCSHRLVLQPVRLALKRLGLRDRDGLPEPLRRLRRQQPCGSPQVRRAD